MATTDNSKQLDELFKQLDKIWEKADPILKKQDELWEKLTKNAKDTDGDGEVDVDENSAEYKELLKLDEQIEAIAKEAEPIEKKIEDLGGFEGTELGKDLSEADQKKLDDLTKKLDTIWEKAEPIFKKQDELWEKLTKNAKDTDGDGEVDVDENSAEYKELLKLDEKIEAIAKEAEPLEKQVNDLLGLDDIVIDDPDFDGDFDGGDMPDINEVKGTDKDDKLTGGDGFDDLFGGKGNDQLSGGKGEDFLFGEEGNDVLTGGEGADVFFFEGKSGKDTVKDFNIKEDALCIDVAFKDLAIKQEKGGTTISWGENSVFLEGMTDKLTEDHIMNCSASDTDLMG